jgi:intraflagellar transport protein 52
MCEDINRVHLIISGTDEDLEYYVRECGDILAVSNQLSADKRSAKHILDYILHQVVEFKKLNQVNCTFPPKLLKLFSNCSFHGNQS